MNNKYIIRVKHPLLRPGLTIETEASEKYVGPVLAKLMELIREHNLSQNASSVPSK
jgi:hypothetical protein